MHHKPIENGWIEVICGSMFCGKTEELLRRLRRAKIANLKVKAFKAKIDNRYSKDKIVSHDKNTIDSIPLSYSSDLFDLGNQYDVVGIDEAQFFDDEIVKVCNDLANNGVRVIVAGLDMDFQGNPFGPMPALMATAEYVTKVHAICTRTGGLANHSFRTSENNSIVLLGEKESYEPLSRAAFYKANIQKKKDSK